MELNSAAHSYYNFRFTVMLTEEMDRITTYKIKCCVPYVHSYDIQHVLLFKH